MTQINMPDTSAIQTQIIEVLSDCEKMQVVSHEEYTKMAEALKRNKSAQKWVKKQFKDAKEAAHEAHKKICATEKAFLDPLVEKEMLDKRKVGAWLQAERKRQQEEQQRLLREAQEAAEREAAEERKRQEEERLQMAEALEAQGFKEEANEVLEAAPIQPVAPVVPIIPIVQDKPKVAGVSDRKKYKVRIVDMIAFVRAVANLKAPVDWLIPNMPALNMQARSLGLEFKVDGLEVIEDFDVSVRAG